MKIATCLPVDDSLQMIKYHKEIDFYKVKIRACAHGAIWNNRSGQHMDVLSIQLAEGSKTRFGDKLAEHLVSDHGSSHAKADVPTVEKLSGSSIQIPLAGLEAIGITPELDTLQELLAQMSLCLKLELTLSSLSDTAAVLHVKTIWTENR